MKQRNRNPRSWSLVGAVLTAAMILSACGGDEAAPAADPGGDQTQGDSTTDQPTDEADTGDDGEQVAAGDGCTLAPVLAEVDGLTGDERLERLSELAKEETDTVSFYGSIGEDDIVPLMEDFQERYGIEVSFYSASSEELLQRVLAEEQAGRAGADVLDNNGTEMILLTREGALAEVESPFSEGLRDGMTHPTWIGTRFNVFTVLYNSNRVSEDEAPRTFSDLADPRWDGGVLGGDSGNWDHFATMVKYMQEKDGLSEEEAIEVWREITDDMVWFNSNTPVAEGVQSGELDAGITYNHYWARFHRRGDTPIAWEPAIEPQVLRPNGVAIPCSAANPAAGLLWLEYLISPTGQNLLAEVTGRDVAYADAEVGMLVGTDYETIVIDLEEVIDNSEKWSELYEELVRG